MKQTTLTLPLKNTDLIVDIQQKPRAKRLGLRLDPTKDLALISAPMRASQKQIHEFLHMHIDWLEEKLALRQPFVSFAQGHLIPVLGQDLIITYKVADKPKVEQLNGHLIIEGFDPIIVPGLTKDWLRDKIFQMVYELSQNYAKIIDKPIRNITIKEVVSRWGSCSHKGNLAYSWRLVFAPLEVVQYVCAHEVAHLREMNHSAAFWEIVKGLCPDYIKHRNWLKIHGRSLFRYGGEN